jgi:hypothetical protein
MSYNLLAEGDLDLFDWSRIALQQQRIEVFPIPSQNQAPDAIGIAIPSSRADEAALDELRVVVEQLWVQGATVHDLMEGVAVATSDDLAAVGSRLLGS